MQRVNHPRYLLRQIETRIAGSSEMSLSGREEDCPSVYFQYKFELARKYAAVSDERLIREAVSFNDHGVQEMAANWLSHERWGRFRKRLAPVLFKSECARVRLQAYWKIANADPLVFHDEIERGLLDPNSAVQGTARGAWRMLLNRDALSFYRSQLRPDLPSARLLAVLRGIRAEGTRDLAAEVRPYLEHASGKVRHEALRALVSWDVEDKIPILLKALHSPSAQILKTASSLLIKNAQMDLVPTFKTLLLEPPHPVTTRVVLGLLRRLPAWKSLALILLSYGLPGNQERALQALSSWKEGYNTSWHVPSPRDVQEVLEAFNAAADPVLMNDRFLIRSIEYLRGKVK